jgi:hypothetical protein
MTEREWAKCRALQPMLQALRDKVSDRKWRLFLVACCREVWTSLTLPSAAGLVETAERFADGLATAEELASAERVLDLEFTRYCEERDIEDEAVDAGSEPEVRAMTLALWTAQTDLWWAVDSAASITTLKEGRRRAGLLREIVGPCLFAGGNVARSWLSYNGGLVRKIAQGAYDERAFERLPILADALEDAGCDNADLLRHCREPGEHVRGCWVVDLLLGKE